MSKYSEEFKLEVVQYYYKKMEDMEQLLENLEYQLSIQ